MTVTRYLGALGAAALLALSLSACGDDEESTAAPDDASVEEFCDAYNTQSDLDEDASAEEQVDEAHDMADKLKDVGTPEDIDDDAREGFEILVNAVGDMDADDVESFTDASDAESFRKAIGASEEDLEKVTAFLTYVSTACSEAPSE
jgi:predicted lipid-binding transport protein (Tim44 family)